MKKECITCGGTGQVGSFLGVSRFLITWEECPDCCGTGYVDQPEEMPGKEKVNGRKKRQSKKNTR